LSIVQGPFSVAPCQTPNATIRNFFAARLLSALRVLAWGRFAPTAAKMRPLLTAEAEEPAEEGAEEGVEAVEAAEAAETVTFEQFAAAWAALLDGAEHARMKMDLRVRGWGAIDARPC
jgi:hypothetical protein